MRGPGCLAGKSSYAACLDPRKCAYATKVS